MKFERVSADGARAIPAGKRAKNSLVASGPLRMLTKMSSAGE